MNTLKKTYCLNIKKNNNIKIESNYGILSIKLKSYIINNITNIPQSSHLFMEFIPIKSSKFDLNPGNVTVINNNNINLMDSKIDTICIPYDNSDNICNKNYINYTLKSTCYTNIINCEGIHSTNEQSFQFQFNLLDIYNNTVDYDIAFLTIEIKFLSK